MKSAGYDGKCFDLAEYYIGRFAASMELHEHLAMHIQNAVDDWIEREKGLLIKAIEARAR